jgi:hypothetical protein
MTRYNGLIFVIKPLRQVYEVVVSDQLFSPNMSLNIMSLTMNDDLFLDKWGPPPLPKPIEQYYGVPQLESSLIELKDNPGAAEWNKSDLLGCGDLLLSSPDPQRPNIVFVINWTDSNSNNAALAIGDLGNSGGPEMLALCPVSFYNTTAGGLEVLNASTAASPGFYTYPQLASNPETNITCTTDPVTGFAECQICPNIYKPVPSYHPKSVPNVLYCFNEVVEPASCRFAYSTLLLKVIAACLAVKAVGLTLTLLSLKSRPVLVLGDAIAEYLQRPDDTTLQCSLKRPKDSQATPSLRQGASVANTASLEEKADILQAFFPAKDWTDDGWSLGALGSMVIFIATYIPFRSGNSVKILSSPTNPRCASSFPY